MGIKNRWVIEQTINKQIYFWGVFVFEASAHETANRLNQAQARGLDPCRVRPIIWEDGKDEHETNRVNSTNMGTK